MQEARKVDPGTEAEAAICIFFWIFLRARQIYKIRETKWRSLFLFFLPTNDWKLCGERPKRQERK